ncbi:hypothetical protein P8625_12010 [Tenacibaculum tangerinum]|uniref:GIY-YIG domain-containing protein n=1 Tax=Tenacibaculum tangerinum TaxID=3038772 RepID=A0ABY8L002_9FLAO|nr:hypothetical protein [Tenacibaculum tangerinum]WGH74802.1 hypothetical protein P8625_12010 [Tenacibaculum tangerinum]
MTLPSFLNTLRSNWEILLPQLVKEAKKSFKNKIEIDFEDDSFLHKIPSSFGVYIFEILPNENFSKELFSKKWKSYKNIKCPNISSSFHKNKDIHNQWNNFYMGKSENLRKRIKEHCFHDFPKTTYGLKLKDRHELKKNSTFSVAYYELKEMDSFLENKEILQFVITNLERSLRNEFQLWVGKQ